MNLLTWSGSVSEGTKEAIEDEKIVYLTLKMFLGPDHQMTKESDANLRRQTKLAVENANKALAEAATSEILQLESNKSEEEKRKKKMKKKKGKGKAGGSRS